MAAPPSNPLQYVQALSQQPFQGSNLPMLLKQLSMKGSNIVPPANLNNAITPPPNNAGANPNGGDDNGGLDYSKLAAGLGGNSY